MKSVVLAGLAVASCGLACVAFGFVGDDDAEAEDGVPLARGTGRVASREEITRRLDESLRRRREELLAFRAMSPAAHLAAAREELGRAPARDGGRVRGWVAAARHARAVPEGAPEAAEARAVLAAAEARADRALSRGVAAIVAEARERARHPAPAARGPCHVRNALSARLTAALEAEGFFLDHICTGSDAAPSLDLTSTFCSRAMLDALAGAPEPRAALRALGFRRATCGAPPVGTTAVAVLSLE